MPRPIGECCALRLHDDDSGPHFDMTDEFNQCRARLSGAPRRAHVEASISRPRCVELHILRPENILVALNPRTRL